MCFGQGNSIKGVNIISKQSCNNKVIGSPIPVFHVDGYDGCMTVSVDRFEDLSW